jgi:hypothetical protein
MINLKGEFLGLVSSRPQVVCVAIVHATSFDHFGIHDGGIEFNLKQGYTPQEYEEFVNSLDFEYEDWSYHGQELYGTIWLSDGTWFQCVRNDHAQYQEWNYYKYPEIPEALKCNS